MTDLFPSILNDCPFKKARFGITINRSVVVRYLAWELGIARANQFLSKSCASRFTAYFRTRKACEGFASRVASIDGWQQGRLGKKLSPTTPLIEISHIEHQWIREVRACNSHDSLVQALKETSNALERVFASTGDVHPQVVKARAALAQVGVEPD